MKYNLDSAILEFCKASGMFTAGDYGYDNKEARLIDTDKMSKVAFVSCLFKYFIQSTETCHRKVTTPMGQVLHRWRMQKPFSGEGVKNGDSIFVMDFELTDGKRKSLIYFEGLFHTNNNQKLNLVSV